MKEINLIKYNISELQFVNKLNRLPNLNFQYSYNVGYSEHNTCRGEFKAVIADKKVADQFSITVTVRGIFTTQAGIAKEILHLKTYDALFPYVKVLVSTFTASAGIPPVYIPYIDISNQSIYRVEMPRPPKPEE